MSSNSSSENPLNKLEDLLTEYLVDKAPFQIPSNGKDAIVKFLPYIIVIFMLFALMGLPAILGFAAMMPYMQMGGYYPSANILYGVLILISLVFEGMAIPGLFSQKEKGWRLLFYSDLIGFVAGLAGGAVISALIGGIIGLYILFQIKEKYD